MIYAELCKKCKRRWHEENPKKDRGVNIDSLMAGYDKIFEINMRFHCHMSQEFLDARKDMPPANCTYILEQTLYSEGEPTNGNNQTNK